MNNCILTSRVRTFELNSETKDSKMALQNTKRYGLLAYAAFATFVAFCVFCVFCVFWFPNDLAGNRPLKSVSSKELVEEINEQQSFVDEYIEKEIKVQGVLKEIIDANNIYALILEGGNGMNVLCEINDNQVKKLSHLKPNQKITLKGVFKGSLHDAILINCTLL